MIALCNPRKDSNPFNKIILPAIICWAALSFQPVFGFDDVIVYRAGSSTWYLSLNPAPYVPGIAPVTTSASWGIPGDSSLIGDVNGDGLDDIVIVRADGAYFDWYAGHTLKTGTVTQVASAMKNQIRFYHKTVVGIADSDRGNSFKFFTEFDLCTDPDNIIQIANVFEERLFRAK